MIGKVRKLKDGNGDYTYPITVAEAVYVSSNQTLKEKLAELSASGPNVGAPGGGSYVIELERWNIANDGTDAENTSLGINQALAWAAEQGYATVILPRGTYLIDERQPVKPRSRMTLDLNGSTLKIRANALEKYAVVLFDEGQQYSRVTNGKIEGDRYEHGYTPGSTHEFGIGVHLMEGVRYITLDHLDIYNTSGDAIIAIASYGGIGGPMPVLAGNLESGGIDPNTGALTNEMNRIRSKVKLPMNVPQITETGYFGLYGDSYGGLGREIVTDLYDVVFYDGNDRFLSSKTQIHFFDEVEVPGGAAYAKVVIRQGTVPSPSGVTIAIRSPRFPKYVFIERCRLHDCRRLGVAICGAKHLYIKECAIYRNQGTAPQGGIDIEDGYDLNQYIHIDRNDIYENESYNIIAVNGRHITITNNRISSGIFTINRSVDKALVLGNDFSHAGPRISGETIFADNRLYACRMLVNNANRKILLNNNYFHNSPINIGLTKPRILLIQNCHFYYDIDFAQALGNIGASLIFSGEPQTISHCVFEGSGPETFSAVLSDTTGGWLFRQISFIDTIHPQNRVMILPPGVYTDCEFINSGRMASSPAAKQNRYEFHRCTFQWSDYTLLHMRANPAVGALQFKGCRFSRNGSGNALHIEGSWSTIELVDNEFIDRSPSTSSAMIQFAETVSADRILIIGNTFASDNNNPAIKANTIFSSIPLLFKDNIANNVQIALSDHHVRHRNFIDDVMR